MAARNLSSAEEWNKNVPKSILESLQFLQLALFAYSPRCPLASDGPPCPNVFPALDEGMHGEEPMLFFRSGKAE